MGPRVVLGITIVLAVATAAVAAAQAPPTAAPDWTDAALGITFPPDLATARLDGTLGIHLHTPTDPELALFTRPRCGASCSADELRAIHAALGPDQQAAFVDMLTRAAVDEVALHLAAVQGLTVERLSGTVALEGLEAPPGGSAFHPPVVVALTGELALDLVPAAAGGRIATLLGMGAALRLQLPLEAAPGENVSLQLRSEGAAAGIAVGARPTTAGETATVSLSNWRGEAAARRTETVVVAHPAVAVPAAEDVGVHVTLDVSDVALDVFRGLDGASLTMRIQVEGDVHALAVAGRLALPPQVDLEHLSADAVRTAYAEFPEVRSAIDAVAADLKAQLEAFTEATGGAPGAVEGGFVPASLAPGAEGPVRLSMSATARLSPAGFGSAMTVARFPLPFGAPFPRIEGFQTTYTMLLPPGIALEDVKVEGGELLASGTDDEGRGVLRFTVTGSEATVQGQAAVSSGFVLRELWWALAIVLAILLLPILLVVALVRRVRRRRRAARHEEAPRPVVRFSPPAR